MRKTDFSFLPEKKRFYYEQLARSYRERERPENIVWTPFEKKLIDSKIAIISIAGAYLKKQKPFTKEDKEQNYKYRELDTNVSSDELKFFALDWETGEIEEDFNVVLPVERLVLLQKEGLIGKIHDKVFSFSGLGVREEWLSKSIKQLVRALKDGECEGAIIIPCSAKTSEIGLKMANRIEKAGVSTAVITPFYEQALVSSPPRCAFINFPFGRILGKADHVTLHTAILRDTLRLFEKAKTPGEILCLNYIWSYGEIPSW